MVANPSLRFLHAEERERGVVRPVVGLAKPAQMREAGVADVVVDLVFESRASAEDKPTVSRPPCRRLELRVRDELAPHIFGCRGAKPDLAVLLGGEAEGTHVRLVVYARGEIPRGHGA